MGGWVSSLVFVLVPQKYYSHTRAYSSNPTIGVAINILPLTKERGKFAASFSLGVGFNQITIDSADGATEKTGFSYFIGYDFLDGEGLSAGIYFGKDHVDLKNGETFNSDTDESQRWVGLTLTTGF